MAEPHVASAALTPDDALLLLATDGVTDVLSDAALMEVAMEALLRVRRGLRGDGAEGHAFP